MNYTEIFQAGSLVWPLTFLLVTLLFFQRVGQELRPIVGGIVGGVAKNAQSNAVQYAIALMFGLSASIGAFSEVFSSLDSAAFTNIGWHQYAVMWGKVANPFFVAILAYATQNNLLPKLPGSTNTAAPFVAVTPPPAGQTPAQ